MKLKSWIILAGLVFILSIGVFGGWNLRKATYKCPVMIQDTIRLWDTVPKYIRDTVPWYYAILDTIILRDTIEIPQNIDSAKIIEDYFALHVYNRKWEAKDTLQVFIKDYITENKSIKNEFSYKWLLPQTIIENNIDNTTSYSKYITLGFSFPLKDFNYLEIESIYTDRKGYVGLGYVPELKSASVKLGINLFTFK